MTEAGHHDVFSAIADPTRRQVLGLLAGGERSVTALAGQRRDGALAPGQ